MGSRAAWVLCLVIACGGDDDASGPMPRRSECAVDADCDDGVFCNGPEQCDIGASAADERGCVYLPPPCAQGEVCDEFEEQCGEQCALLPDADGDGAQAAACGGDDCDDSDPDRFPGNTEVCDPVGHDEDCDDSTTGGRDRDQDGFDDALCCVGGECDCDDTRADVNPESPEACNSRDDDCDGSVDEGVAVALFEDRDRDGDGDPAAPIMGCPGLIYGVPFAEDCDDDDPSRWSLGAVDFCDGADNDCDSMIDETLASVRWYRDRDGDGFGSIQSGTQLSCEQPAGFVLQGTDCDDDNPAVHPAAVEVCNGLDDDCRGGANFEIAPGDTEDDDRDGVADSACGGSDCDDDNPLIGARAAEVCNGVDDDCDDSIDETGRTLYFVDADGDGFGAGSTPIPACFGRDGYAPRGGDCDDRDPARRPMAAEVCNSRDDDCDGAFDEGAHCDVVDVQLGFFHSCALRRNGDVSCWGDDRRGQMNNGPGEQDELTPVRIAGVGGASALATGAESVCVLVNGEVICWGDNSFGQLGRAVASSEIATPAPMVGLSDAIEVQIGGNFSASTCVRRADRTLSCVGYNGAGRLGLGDETDRTTLEPVVGLGPVSQLAMAATHTCALSSGQVYCWGSNNNGQVGSGTMDDQLTPIAVALPTSAVEIQTATGASCARIADGSLRCWGSSNAYSTRSPPVADLLPVESDDLQQHPYSGRTQLVMEGDAACFFSAGSNYYCPDRFESSPASVVDPLAYRISEQFHRCALMSPRRILCWGSELSSNSNGQLGDGTTMGRREAGEVLGI